MGRYNFLIAVLAYTAVMAPILFAIVRNERRLRLWVLALKGVKHVPHTESGNRQKVYQISPSDSVISKLKEMEPNVVLFVESRGVDSRTRERFELALTLQQMDRLQKLLPAHTIFEVEDRKQRDRFREKLPTLMALSHANG